MKLMSISGLSIQDILEGTAGEPIFQYDCCRLGQDGKFYLSSAVNRDSMPGFVIALTDIPINFIGNFLKRGEVINNQWSFITGNFVYVGTEPGKLMQTLPENTGEQLQIIGIALAPNMINFEPNFTLLEIA